MRHSFHSITTHRRSTRLGRAVAFAAIAVVTTSHAGEPSSVPQNVTVHGDARGLRLGTKDHDVASSSIGEDELRGAGATAVDVLRGEPGVAVIESGGYGELSTASLRGATAAETPVYLGGIRLNDDVGGAADLSTVPLWLLRRVEIYRGNAPIEADRLGIGGAIFFEPKRPRKSEAAIGGLVGSYGARGVWGDGAVGDKRAAALVGVRYNSATNDYLFRDDQGAVFSGHTVERRRTNADVETLDVWAISHGEIGRASIDVVVNGMRRNQGVPGLTLLPTRETRAVIDRTLFGISAGIPCSEGDRCRIASTTSLIQTHAGYSDPLREAAFGAVRLDTRGARVEQALSVTLAPIESLTIRPVVNAAVERLAIEPGSGDGLSASRVTTRAAVTTKWYLGRNVSLNAVVSGECFATSKNGAPNMCDRAQPTGRIGISWGDTRLSLVSNVSRYVRVPTLGELYGVSGTVRGDDRLLAESGFSAEVGVRGQMPIPSRVVPIRAAYADAFGFVRGVSDLIAYRRSSLGYIAPYNIGQGRVAGFELLTGLLFAPNGSSSSAPNVRAEVALTLLDPRDTTPNRTLANDIVPYRSRLIVSPRLRAESRKYKAFYDSRAMFDIRYTYQTNRFADPAGLIVIPAQSSLDAEIALSLFSDTLTTRVRGANLLNAARFDQIGYPLPGRSVFVSMEVQW